MLQLVKKALLKISRNSRKFERFKAISGSSLLLNDLSSYPINNISEGGFSIKTAGLTLESLEKLIQEGKGELSLCEHKTSVEYVLLYKTGDDIGLQFTKADHKAVKQFYHPTSEKKAS